MAIAPSYPMGTPKLTDTVIGVQYEEMKDPAVKNFSINDIAALVPAQPAQLPYKVYMFKLDRSTGVPITLQDYENTIGLIVLSNGPSGTVKATLAGAFTTDKVIIFTQGVPSSPIFSSTVNDINFSGATSNFIEIRVYN